MMPVDGSIQGNSEGPEVTVAVDFRHNKISALEWVGTSLTRSCKRHSSRLPMDATRLCRLRIHRKTDTHPWAFPAQRRGRIPGKSAWIKSEFLYRSFLLTCDEMMGICQHFTSYQHTYQQNVGMSRCKLRKPETRKNPQRR